MRKAAILVLALALAACAAVPVPKTPGQTVYALEGAYTTAARAEVAYMANPHADATAIKAIRAADQVAYDDLVAAQKAVQSGKSATAAAAISTASDAIDALAKLLHAKGII